MAEAFSEEDPLRWSKEEASVELEASTGFEAGVDALPSQWRLILILGENASGKSRLLESLARRFGTVGEQRRSHRRSSGRSSRTCSSGSSGSAHDFPWDPNQVGSLPN